MIVAKYNSKLAALALAGALAAGCATQPDASKAPTTAATPSAKQAPTGQKGAQNPAGPNVAPMGGVGAGGITPVAGTEGVEGGGSGVGTALKAKAKAAAAGASQSSGQDDTGQ